MQLSGFFCNVFLVLPKPTGKYILTDGYTAISLLFFAGLELVGNTKRVFTGIVIELFWCGGELLLAGIAYFLPNWRHMQISFSVFIGLFLSFWM